VGGGYIQTTILHFDGASWTEMDSGTIASLHSVWGSSPNDVFAVGHWGTTLHYDGEISATHTSELEEANLAPATLSDAAMVLDLPAGKYTFHVKSEGDSWFSEGPAGVGLAEVFDLEGGSGTAFLENISARAYVQTGDDILIAGFIIEGTGTKKVALRGIGQGLRSYGVATDLDALIEVYDENGQVMGVNDDYGDGDSVIELEQADLIPPDPTDAAFVVDLPAGAYTVHLIPKNASGIGLVEVYDLEPESSAAVLHNISSRAYIQGGDEKLIAGFIIGGTGTKKVALRGIGQGLISQGVNTDLNASILLYDVKGRIVEGNQRWGTDLFEVTVVPPIPPLISLEQKVKKPLGGYPRTDF
jgi:hypothetical protein